MSKKEIHEFIKKNKKLRPPFLAEYARSLFGVFLVVFIIRSFFIGNFLIPSSSMSPTIPVGSFIFVNKISYVIKNPITNKVWFKINKPKRNDIVVFNFPVNPKVDFIKRIIGIPGDTISYKNKELIINNKKAEYINCIFLENQKCNKQQQQEITCYEKIDFKKHKINKTNNNFNSNEFTDLNVPEGMYFVLGDNRDNSQDSRYWGFVSEENLVGKATFIWFSWNTIDHSIRWNKIGNVS